MMNMKLGMAFFLVMTGCGGATDQISTPADQCPWTHYECAWEAPLESDPIISRCMDGFRACDPTSPCVYYIYGPQVTLIHGTTTEATCFAPDVDGGAK